MSSHDLPDWLKEYLPSRPTPPTPGGREPSPRKPAKESMKAKVVLAGAPCVGKTSLIRRYVLNDFSDKYKETLGAIVYKRDVEVAVGSRTVQVTMTIWDTVGQTDGPSPFRDLELFGAQGVLAVGDVTDPRSLPAVDRRVAAALASAGDIPVQILLNKADLGPEEEARVAGLRTGLERGVLCYLTSAKQGDNVESAFEDLARRVVERSLLPPSGPYDGIDRQLLVECASQPLSPEDVARMQKIPLIFAEARLERLRTRGYLNLAALALDDAGLPRFAYGRTRKPFAEVLSVRA